MPAPCFLGQPGKQCSFNATHVKDSAESWMHASVPPTPLCWACDGQELAPSSEAGVGQGDLAQRMMARYTASDLNCDRYKAPAAPSSPRKPKS